MVDTVQRQHTPTAAAGREAPALFLITLTAMLGTLMAVIDSSIVNVALPNMAGNLDASIDDIGWVTTAYILAQVIVMPLNGWLTGRFGRRNFYAVSLLVFTIASFLCGTATDVWELVAFRILQGLGSGGLQPTAQAILMESYPPARRAAAIAIFGMGVMVGPAIGPWIGGIFIDNFSWPLIFFINVPIGVITVAMTLFYIRTPSYVQRDSSRVDFLGLGLMTVGLSSLQYVLERGQRLDWFSSDQIVLLSVVAVVTLVIFVIRQLRDPNPLVDLRVFRSRGFAAGNVISIVSGFGLFGTAVILPLFMQTVLGFTPTDAGLILVPGAIATIFSLQSATLLLRVLDGRAVIALGLAIFAVGVWWMGDLTQDAGYWDVFWPRVLQGFALGFLFVPLTTATLTDVSNAEMGGATGVYSLIRQLGGSLGIAVLLFLQTRFADTAYVGLASSVILRNPNVANALATKSLSALQLYGMVSTDATVISYDMLFRLCGITFGLCIPLVLLLRTKRRES